MDIYTLKEMIKTHEGYSNVQYKCPAGHVTIGWGHNCDANPLPEDILIYLRTKGFIAPSHSERLLDMDISIALSACRRLFPEFGSFEENRQIALVDWVFQLGEGTARKFVKTIAAINARQWEDAAKEMIRSEWAKQTPKRAQEISDMIEEG